MGEPKSALSCQLLAHHLYVSDCAGWLCCLNSLCYATILTAQLLLPTAEPLLPPAQAALKSVARIQRYEALHHRLVTLELALHHFAMRKFESGWDLLVQVRRHGVLVLVLFA